MADHQPKSYKIVAISLYRNDLAEADQLVDALRRSGWPKANRSLIMREALLRLSRDLAGKSDDEILQVFLDSSRTQAAKS